MGNVVYLPVKKQRASARTPMTSILIWIRTIGDRALAPSLCLMCAVTAVAYFQLLASNPWAYWSLVGTLVALIMTIPLSVLIFESEETWVELRAETKRQAKAKERFGR